MAPMPRKRSDYIDAVLLTGCAILSLLIARLLLDDWTIAQAVALITPVTLVAPDPVSVTPEPVARLTLVPTIQLTPMRSPIPRPTATLRPNNTPTWMPTATFRPSTVAKPRGALVPSVTPNGTAFINRMPVWPPASPVPLPKGSITIALLGSDKRPTGGDYRTDTIILVNVNPKLSSRK